MKIQDVRIIVVAILITSIFVYATARTPVVEDNEVELSVARMAKVGFASSPTFSPDGSRIQEPFVEVISYQCLRFSVLTAT